MSAHDCCWHERELYREYRHRWWECCQCHEARYTRPESVGPTAEQWAAQR